MTLILAAKDKQGNVFIGSDNRAWENNAYFDQDYKLINIGDYIVGYTYSYRTAQLIEFNKNVFPKSISKRSDVFKFGQQLKKLMLEDGQIERAEKSSDIEHTVSLIIATPKRIYKMYGNYQFEERPIAAQGSGTDYSIGYFNGLSYNDFNRRIKESIINTGKYTHTVSQKAKVIKVSPKQ